MLDYIKGLSELTLKGLIATKAPNILKGSLNQLFRQYNITVEVIIPLIQENKSLWSLLPPKHYSKISRVMSQVGDISWFTSDWLIEAVKEEHRALASLFLSWRKGRNWLNRQVNEIKEEIETL